MSKLDAYARLVEQKNEVFKTLMRVCGPWRLGPTNRGGFFFQCHDKEVKTDISEKDLYELRDLIQDFITNVIEK